MANNKRKTRVSNAKAGQDSSRLNFDTRNRAAKIIVFVLAFSLLAGVALAAFAGTSF